MINEHYHLLHFKFQIPASDWLKFQFNILLQEADVKVTAFKERWTVVHECFKEWVARMTTLVRKYWPLIGRDRSRDLNTGL